MPEKGVYNIILMRDTSNAVRFRIPVFWIRVAVVALLAFLFSCATGTYLGFSRSVQNHSLKKENRFLKGELQKAEMEVKRLHNISLIMDSYDVEELQAVENHLKQGTKALMPPVDLEEIFSKKDMQIIYVDNVQGRFTDNNLRLSYSINNLQTSDSVTGETFFSLITRDGVLVDIGMREKGFFEIQRFKAIEVSLPLPEELDTGEIFAVRLRITSESGETIFSETFPLSHILS